MNPAPFRVESLSNHHERNLFDCGEEALDRYFRTQVTQDIRRRVASCFVVVEVSTGRVAGYYTLAATSIPFTEMPVADIRKLPRYPSVPAVRIGRLAVDRAFQGRGIGASMLVSAENKSAGADIAAFMLVVDAKNEQAVAFYERHGFRPIHSAERTLFRPFVTKQRLQ